MLSRVEPSASKHGASRLRVDAYIANAPGFSQPILHYLRERVHEAAPDALEEFKWSRPFFVVCGRPVCYLAAFKQHCGFGFWSPEMVAVLKADGIEESGASGSFGRITALQDLPVEAHLLRYIRHAADRARAGDASTPMASGRSRGPSAKVSIPIPPQFATALANSEEANAVFERMSPSCRREYLAWITSAKRPETQERRIQEAIVRLSGEKSFNEQYRSK